MKLLALGFFFLAANLCAAQNLLIKKNGEQVSYKKYKISEEHYEVVLDNKEKIKISLNDVVAYYDSRVQKLFYKKPLVKHNEKLLFPLSPVDTANSFQMLAREEVGKINLYTKEVFTGSGANSTSVHYYYAEKGDVFLNVLITGLGDKKDDLEALKSLVVDNGIIASRLTAENFHLNFKNLIKAIKDYNLASFAAPNVSDYERTGTVSFYTSVGPKLRESVLLKINDSIEYRMPKTFYPLAVKIPLEVPSKVCVIREEGTSCSLIQPIRFATDAYELTYHIMDKTFEIRQSTPYELQSYMTRARAK